MHIRLRRASVTVDETLAHIRAIVKILSMAPGAKVFDAGSQFLQGLKCLLLSRKDPGQLSSFLRQRDDLDGRVGGFADPGIEDFMRSRFNDATLSPWIAQDVDVCLQRSFHSQARGGGLRQSPTGSLFARGGVCPWAHCDLRF